MVIKYVPYAGDSKRALDEYPSALMLGGTNTLTFSLNILFVKWG